MPAVTPTSPAGSPVTPGAPGELCSRPLRRSGLRLLSAVRRPRRPLCSVPNKTHLSPTLPVAGSTVTSLPVVTLVCKHRSGIALTTGLSRDLQRGVPAQVGETPDPRGDTRSWGARGQAFPPRRRLQQRRGCNPQGGGVQRGQMSNQPRPEPQGTPKAEEAEEEAEGWLDTNVSPGHRRPGHTTVAERGPRGDKTKQKDERNHPHFVLSLLGREGCNHHVLYLKLNPEEALVRALALGGGETVSERRHLPRCNEGPRGLCGATREPEGAQGRRGDASRMKAWGPGVRLCLGATEATSSGGAWLMGDAGKRRGARGAAPALAGVGQSRPSGNARPHGESCRRARRAQDPA